MMRPNSSLDNHPQGQNRTGRPVEFNSQALAAWLDELPLTNIDYSGDAVLAVLREMNEQQGLSSVERFRMLEQLRPTAYMLSQQAAERYLHDPAFPLPAPLERHADRGPALSSELGRGYRLAMASEDSLSSPASGEDSRALIIDRALEAYATTLLRLREAYRIPPPGFWQDVYGLYQWAETRRLHRLRIAEHNPSSGVTVLDRFTQIVLFALSSSHRHRPGKIRQIYELLGTFANKAQIRATSVLNEQNALFCLDLGTDVPPQRIDTLNGSKNDRQRFAFTHALIQFLLKHYEDPANRRLKGGVLDTSLLKRLLKALGAMERRKSPRNTGDGQCRLVVGLDSLVAVLAGTAQQNERFVTNASIVHYKGIGWLTVPNHALEGLHSGESTGNIAAADRIRSELSIGKALYENKEVVTRDDIWAANETDIPSADPEASRLSGHLVNSSARGHCLLWTNREVASAKVGELVGLGFREGSLHIGVIRWLRQATNADLTLGVELLSPKADVVKVNFIGERESGRNALLLPSNAGLQQTAGLLISPSQHDTGNVMVTTGSGVAKTYRLGKLLESTPSFQYFSLI
ncbi:MAG TPA: hypothetical protein VLU73_07215 [Methylococcaceae bacterium]|nr:hypothetical protein [Methylococcaceae bacterium]